MTAGILAALPALFLIDAALFRSGFYPYYLEPEATAGSLERAFWVEAARMPGPAKQALAFGDSRLGLRPRIADEAVAGRGYEFATVAVPGTSPRCWYYLLRDLDPAARRYSVILLPVDDYDDEDRKEDRADDAADLRYIVNRMRLSDVADFTASFPSWQGRWQALRGGLFKGVVYKEDLHALLLDPRARLARVRAFRRNAALWLWNYDGLNRDMKGLAVDWSAWKITVPPGTTPAMRTELEDVLLRRPAPQTGRLAAYRKEWFGRIMDRYRGTATRIVFFRLPRGPVVRPDSLIVKRSSSIREFESRRNVLLLDEHLFEGLERPEFFMDALHLNAAGMARFSSLLAARMVDRLEPPAGTR